MRIVAQAFLDAENPAPLSEPGAPEVVVEPSNASGANEPDFERFGPYAEILRNVRRNLEAACGDGASHDAPGAEPVPPERPSSGTRFPHRPGELPSGHCPGRRADGQCTGQRHALGDRADPPGRRTSRTPRRSPRSGPAAAGFRRVTGPAGPRRDDLRQGIVFLPGRFTIVIVKHRWFIDLSQFGCIDQRAHEACLVYVRRINPTRERGRTATANRLAAASGWCEARALTVQAPRWNSPR